MDKTTKDHHLDVVFRLPLVGDGIEYIDANNKSAGYKVVDGDKTSTTILYDSIVKSMGARARKDGRQKQNAQKKTSESTYPTTPNEHHRRITLLGGKSSASNVRPTYLVFHLKLRSSNLLIAPYSDYQHFLYETITSFLDKGWNFQQIADWLNDNGYTTPRGKKFRNAHAHSIVKKKKNRDVKISKTYEPNLSDFSLRFIDKTICNQ